jgi:hypothetical protein
MCAPSRTRREEERTKEQERSRKGLVTSKRAPTSLSTRHIEPSSLRKIYTVLNLPDDRLSTSNLSALPTREALLHPWIEEVGARIYAEG